MIDTKELRRKLGSDDPIDHFGIHVNVKSTLAELLDRLEAAEKELESWKGLAKQFGNEADALRAAVRHEADCVEACKAEVETLRAGIEEMEKQEPGFRERCTPSSPTGYSNQFPLYALPGAKGE